jgi:hypothetical protein
MCPSQFIPSRGVVCRARTRTAVGGGEANAMDAARPAASRRRCNEKNKSRPPMRRPSTSRASLGLGPGEGCEASPRCFVKPRPPALSNRWLPSIKRGPSGCWLEAKVIECLPSQHLGTYPLLDRGADQRSDRSASSVDARWMNGGAPAWIKPSPPQDASIHPSIHPPIHSFGRGHCLCIPNYFHHHFNQASRPSPAPPPPPPPPSASRDNAISPHSLHHPHTPPTPRPFEPKPLQDGTPSPLTPSPSTSPSRHVVTAPPLRGPARHGRNH